MKKIKIFSLLMLALPLLASACAKSSETPKEETISISLNVTETKLTIGDFTKIIASNSKDEKDFSIKWKSTNGYVASVDEEGRVEALNEGETYIIASHDNIKAYCKVVVTAGYFIPTLHFVNSVSDVESLAKGDRLNLQTYVLYNGREFYDLETKYEVSNMSAGLVNNGIFTAGDISNVSTDVIVTASWRDFSNPTLTKKVHIDITPIGEIYINDGEVSDMSLYTVDRVLDEEYKHVQVIESISGYYDGQVRGVANVELINNKSLDDPNLPAARLDYFGTNNNGSITGLREGSAELRVVLEGGYEKTFKIDVNLPYFVINEPVNMFSVNDGLFYDEATCSFKSLGTLFPVGGETITKVYQDNKLLTTDGSRVTGINLDGSTSMKEVSVVIYNQAMSVKLKLQSYTKVVTQISDFVDIISTSETSGQRIKGLYYLANDIDGLSSPLSIPSGRKINTFEGIFEGNGHVIKVSLKRTKTDTWGLFGTQLNGTVRNIAFKDCIIEACDAGLIAQSSGVNGVLNNVYINVDVDTTGRSNTPVMGTFSSTYGSLTIKNTIIDIPTKLQSSYDNGYYFDGALGIHKLKSGSSDSYIVSKSEIGRRYITDVEASKKTINMKSYNYQSDADADTEFINIAGGVQHIISDTMLKKFSTYQDMKNGNRDYSTFSVTYWDLSQGYPRFKGAF